MSNSSTANTSLDTGERRHLLSQFSIHSQLFSSCRLLHSIPARTRAFHSTEPSTLARTPSDLDCEQPHGGRKGPDVIQLCSRACHPSGHSGCGNDDEGAGKRFEFLASLLVGLVLEDREPVTLHSQQGARDSFVEMACGFRIARVLQKCIVVVVVVACIPMMQSISLSFLPVKRLP